MRLALVHDYLVEAGGAERVLAALHELYPAAPIYTSVFDPRTTLAGLDHSKVRTSFLQRLPHSRRIYKWWLPLYPLAFEQFDLSGYDVVLSQTTSFAKGVITGPDTLHVCYCHTPSRFAWRYHDYLRRERLGRLARFLLPLVVHRLRAWDFAAAQRVDHFIAGSQNAARRIRKYYGRDAAVIPLPSTPPSTRRPHRPLSPPTPQTLRSPSLPTFQPSNLPTFQPSNAPKPRPPHRRPHPRHHSPLLVPNHHRRGLHPGPRRPRPHPSPPPPLARPPLTRRQGPGVRS